jgi:hypothetical protein
MDWKARCVCFEITNSLIKKSMRNKSGQFNFYLTIRKMKKKPTPLIFPQWLLILFACIVSYNGLLGTRLSAQSAVNSTNETKAQTQPNPGFCLGKTGRFIPVTGLVTSASYRQAEDKLELVVSGSKIKELLDAHKLPFRMRNFYLRFGGTSQWNNKQKEENRKLIRIFNTDPQLGTFAAVIQSKNYQRRSYFEDELENLKTRHDAFYNGSCNEQPVLKLAGVNTEQDTPLRIALTSEGKAIKPEITVREAFISESGEIAVSVILGDHAICCYEILQVLSGSSR